MAYTVLQFRRAYVAFANELAEQFGKNAFDSAKTHPDDGMYSQRMYVHSLVANEVYRLLKTMFVDFDVDMKFDDEDRNYGTATFIISWE